MKELIIVLLFAFVGADDSHFINYDSYMNKVLKKNHIAQYYSKQQWDVLNFTEKENLYFQHYFVSVSGSGENNGLSEEKAWSLSFAMRNAAAGDIINVKAGDYGAMQQSMHQDGNRGNPHILYRVQNYARRYSCQCRKQPAKRRD